MDGAESSLGPCPLVYGVLVDLNEGKGRQIQSFLPFSTLHFLFQFHLGPPPLSPVPVTYLFVIIITDIFRFPTNSLSLAHSKSRG